MYLRSNVQRNFFYFIINIFYLSIYIFKALYCIVLYCIVLYCIVLYCIVLYCIVNVDGHGLVNINENKFAHSFLGRESLSRL